MTTHAAFSFCMTVAWRVQNLLQERKALLRPEGIVFYVWPRGERVVVAFDPTAIDTAKINEDFVHRLSTRLGGRVVVRTNSRGMWLQVGFDVPAAPVPLDAIPLDLSQQPSPWHMPVGMTGAGALWISLTEGDSFLVGGSRGGGKTGELHGWVQALLHGGKTRIYASDGKRGLEFSPYAVNKNFRFFLDPLLMLEDLQAVLRGREMQLAQSGHPNILMHNDAGEEFIEPIALIVDEAADLPEQAKDMLKSMIRLYRHLGLYPIIATNQPTVADVFAKTNLSTRVAFRVPHHNDSITMLGYKGAEALPDERGRGLIVWKGRFIEFQSFLVSYPQPTDETRQLVAAAAQAAADRQPDLTGAAGDLENEKVLQLIAEGYQDAAIVRKVWGVYGGGKFYKLKEKVQALRTSSSSSTPQGAQEEPQTGQGEEEEVEETEA